MMKIIHLFTKSCLHFNPAIHVFRDAFLGLVKAKGKAFLIFSVLFHFNALGNSECKDIFSDSFSRIYQINLRQFSAERKGDTASIKQLNADLDSIGRRVQARYEEDPEQFLSLFRENLNIHTEDTLKMIKYMPNPPLEVFQLIIKEVLEKDDNTAKSLAYRAFLTTEIKYKSVLQWLESKKKKLQEGDYKYEAERTHVILINRVLNEQRNRQLRKLPQSERPGLIIY